MSEKQVPPADEVGRERLGELLQHLGKKGVTQQEISKRAGLAPSYLTDVKLGRRPLGELVARRLGEAFEVDYRWLLGEIGTMDPVRVGSATATPGPTSVWLPVFPYPIEGPPQTSATWDGSSVEISGVAAALVRLATRPYILRYGADDRRGRLQKDDLLLISQSIDEAAEIQVVRNRGKLYLARSTGAGTWERVASKRTLHGPVEAAGHAIGIVWGRLR
jgi:transcriptional regulator with XRE-family HTH domain